MKVGSLLLFALLFLDSGTVILGWFDRAEQVEAAR